MGVQYSVAVNNARLDQWEATIGTAPIMKLFSGSLPANCAAADPSGLLVSITLPSDWMAAAASASKSKSGTWQATASGNGFAAVYRIYDSGGATCHEQGIVSMAWAGSTAYAVGNYVTNGGNLYRCTTAGTSASSGGPSGTGGSISDGGAVWAYVQAGADLSLDNASIASGQVVTIGTFTRNAANT